jgi:hypothetical protein
MLKVMGVDKKYLPEQQEMWYDAKKDPFDETPGVWT